MQSHMLKDALVANFSGKMANRVERINNFGYPELTNFKGFNRQSDILKSADRIIQDLSEIPEKTNRDLVADKYLNNLVNGFIKPKTINAVHPGLIDNSAEADADEDGKKDYENNVTSTLNKQTLAGKTFIIILLLAGAGYGVSQSETVKGFFN